MLPLPKLNGQSFQDVAVQSVKKIEKYTKNWNDTDIHDPGVMLIELFSYLNVRQQEKINRVGEKSLHKFLDLIGMSLENAKPAEVEVLLSSDTDVSLPLLTKFRFQDIVFETVKRVEVMGNSIYEISEPYVFGKSPRQGNSFEIAFEKPLPKDRTVSMYIEILDDYTVKRNKITDPGEFIPTSIIKWEYYGKRDFELGWHSLHIEADETYHLLFSGSVSFKTDGLHAELNGRYLIRGTLLSNLYETAPKILNIGLNSTRLVQQDTKCKTFLFSHKAFKANRMYVDCCLAYSGAYELYIKSGDFWTKAEDLDVVYLLKEDGEFFRFGTSKRDELSSVFEDIKEDDFVFKLVLYEKEFYDKRFVGSSNGFTNQIFRLNYHNVSRDEFEIMVRGRENGWRIFERVDNFDNSAPDDNHYIFNEREQAVLFGDNEFGIVPSALPDNIIITSLKTTMGENGNIKMGGLTKPLQEEFFPSVSVWQHQNAAGGKNSETIEDVVYRISRTLNSIQKAVTKQDYEEIAKKTQGLMIENATALPLYKPKSEGSADNTVTVVIEPFTAGLRLTDERYLQNVLKALNKKKLITTKVYVVYPMYLGIEIYCEVVLKEYYKNFEADICCEIKRFVKEMPLGGCVSHGELCGVIERIPNILYTRYLQMEIPMSRIRKNELGDIEVPPHVRVYVRSVDIVQVL